MEILCTKINNFKENTTSYSGKNEEAKDLVRNPLESNIQKPKYSGTLNNTDITNKILETFSL